MLAPRSARASPPELGHGQHAVTQVEGGSADREQNVTTTAAGIGLKSKKNAPSTEVAPDPGLIKLPGECQLASIASLHNGLLAVQELAEPVTLDVGQLERVDTASMQLILTFILDRATAERAVKISGTSTAWSEAVNTLGFSRLLLVAA